MPSTGNANLKTTYFLGAGASAAISKYQVTTGDLLRVALQTKVHDDKIQDVERATQLVRLMSPAGEEPTIDELLAIIDLALLENLPLSPEWPLSRLTNARHSLNRLIYDCIEEAIHGDESNLDGSPLMQLLKSCRGDPGKVVVTLNWDCLVERTFRRITGQEEGMINYGIQCVRPNGNPVPVDKEALLVLKPHGSLSWGHCPLCGLLVADLVYPFEFTTGRKCPECPRTELQFVLVPPAAYNQQWPWFLAALWDQVEQVIHKSDRLVFIGYSFPPQDAHVRVHLVRALARRTQKRPIQVEVIVKADTAAPWATEWIHHRYKSILGGFLGIDGFKFQQQGFADWMSKEEL